MAKDESDSDRGNPLPPHRLLFLINEQQDNTYHSLCYTSHGALAGTRNSMCCSVCGMVHIKDFLLLIRTSSPCSGGSGFSLSLSLSGPLPYVQPI